MHELSIMKGNIFTVKLHDIIIPAASGKDLKSFDAIFLVMDFVERDISTLFTVDRPQEFNEDHIMCIFYNILCALNFLETANIIHRDLKPSNILISNDCRIKICDFGFARTIPNFKNDQSDCQACLSQDSTNDSQSSCSEHQKDKEKSSRRRDLSPHCFTRWYRPPEVILGQSKYDTSADIWSVGCALAEGIKQTDQYQ